MGAASARKGKYIHPAFVLFLVECTAVSLLECTAVSVQGPLLEFLTNSFHAVFHRTSDYQVHVFLSVCPDARHAWTATTNH